MKIQFTVYAKPEPQGSVRAFTPKGWNRPVLTSDNPDLKKYRKEIECAAFEAIGEPFGKDVELSVTAVFYFERPKSAPKKRARPTVRPDVDKLGRAVLDGLGKNKSAYTDDAQVVKATFEKFYGSPERTEITIETLDQEPLIPRAA